MENKHVILTYDGLKKLQDELEYLKTIRRKEITENIKVALSFGDLSENSEYDEAKNEQAKTELRIAEIEAKLNNAQIIDEDEIDTATVSIGSKVVIQDSKNHKIEYSIVGSTEADPDLGRLSDESPIGKALLGHRPGETVKVVAPAGTLTFKIVSISK